MKRSRCVAMLLVLAVLNAGCGTMRNLFSGSAQENAVQALVTTTRSAVLLMTAAGIVHDNGGFGPLGSDRAEDTWAKISVESLRMNEALNAWTAAIIAGQDGGPYANMVAQALAVIGALLPTKQRLNSLIMPPIIGGDGPLAIELLARPDSFRLAGGVA